MVQLYLHDVQAQVARPVKLLTGFARVSLDPGEDVDVQFSLHADRTAFTGIGMQRIVEPGDVEILVGTSADDLPCRATFAITGAERIVGHERRLDTPVKLIRRGTPPTNG